MAQGEPSKLLTPLIAGCAVIALGAAWFTPLPGPDEPQTVVRIGPGSGGDASQNRTVRAVGFTPDHDWSVLAEPLNTLRVPLAVIPPPDDQGNTGPDIPPVPPPPPIRYLGLISAGEGRSAALIDIGGNQRFVSTGDIISGDLSSDLLVKEITAEKIVLERSGIETPIMRERRPDQRPGAAPSSADNEPPVPGRISDR